MWQFKNLSRIDVNPFFSAFVEETWAAWQILCLSVLQWRAPWDGPLFDDAIGNRQNIVAVTVEFSNFV